MGVALLKGVMLLSELTIIYFATAAPFGVASFLRQPSRGTRRAGALARAAGAALLWPLAALLLLLGRGSASGGGREEEACAQGTPDETRAERAKRALTNALRAAEDVWDEEGEDETTGGSRGARGEERRHAMFAARESVERYVGLTLACAGASTEASPSARELELCRLAGSAGDDLLLAGRCIHRRNVTRLFAHRERARAEMIHALAAVREVAGDARALTQTHTSTQTRTSTQKRAGLQKHTSAQPHTRTQPCAHAARRASEALLRAFALAVELFSLLEDEEAARRAARLLDAECARLRRLEAEGDVGAPEGGREGALTCTTQAAHKAFANQLSRTTTSRRGLTG